jgi:TolB-like protein
LSSLFAELKRRNVFRVAIAYVAVAWLILQVSDIVLDNIAAPPWLMKALMFFLVIGFPVAVLFAWAYEMTPEGLKREKDVDRSASITQQTGQKLNRMIIGVLVAAVAFLLVDKFALRETATKPDASIEKSVAVLPFVAMSRGEDDEYFADGLTEEILNSLTRVPDLLVTARTSAFHFKGQDIPVPEIADKLGVAHVVEGSVRRDGERLRVTAQLIRADDGFHLWSENYDRNTEDTFGVQTDIAEKIASALGVILDADTLEKMKAEGFRNPEAYVAYQKARAYYDDAHDSWNTGSDLVVANEWFDRVIELEPAKPRIYLLRGDYYTHLLTEQYVTLDEEERRKAVEGFNYYLDMAVRTPGDNASRLAVSFDHALLKGNWGRVHQILDDYSAAQGCPTNAWLNTVTVEFGKARQVASLGKRIIECDPQNPFGYWYSMQAHIWLGEYDEAIRIGETAIKVMDSASTKQGLFHAYLGAQRIEDAERLIKTFTESREDMAEWHLAVAAARGDAAKASADREIILRNRADRKDIQLLYLPRIGDRETANRIAAELDALPYGYLTLMSAPNFCMCGAPWDIEVTPNYAKRIEDAGFTWPPASPINWPLKDW